VSGKLPLSSFGAAGKLPLSSFGAAIVDLTVFFLWFSAFRLSFCLFFLSLSNSFLFSLFCFFSSFVLNIGYSAATRFCSSMSFFFCSLVLFSFGFGLD
jgi:hypothetical protein